MRGPSWSPNGPLTPDDALEAGHVGHTHCGTWGLANSICPISGHGRWCPAISCRSVQNPAPETLCHNPVPSTPHTPSHLRSLAVSWEYGILPTRTGCIHMGREETTMRSKSSPARAPAAYCRQMVQQTRGRLPLEALPSRTCEETREERDSALVRPGARTLAVSW